MILQDILNSRDTPMFHQAFNHHLARGSSDAKFGRPLQENLHQTPAAVSGSADSDALYRVYHQNRQLSDGTLVNRNLAIGSSSGGFLLDSGSSDSQFNSQQRKQVQIQQILLRPRTNEGINTTGHHQDLEDMMKSTNSAFSDYNYLFENIDQTLNMNT